MNAELIKALIDCGGIVGALGFIWLIVKAVVPLLPKAKTNGNGAALEVRVGTLEKEVAGLREWRHDMNDAAQGIIARDYMNKKSSG